MEALTPRATDAGLSIEVRTSDGPPLMADPDRIEQVLFNLLSNAVAFNRPGGSITVDACCDDQDWTLAVADTGIGVPADEQDQLFRRFFRATNARDARTPGTGLGLAISRSIVELHGGTIGMESTPGVGTTAWFRLPLGTGASGGDD